MVPINGYKQSKLIKSKKHLYGLLAVLLISSLAYLAWASHQANSYQLGEDLGIVRFGSGNSLLSPTLTAVKINISNRGNSSNLTLVLNTSNASLQHIQNVSIMFYPRNLSFGAIANYTLSNVSGEGGCFNLDTTDNRGWNCTNRSYWNFSLRNFTVFDGTYNLTVLIENDTGITGVGSNSTFAFNITVDNTPPNITYLFINVTNQSGYTTNFTRGGVIRLNATVNDSTTYVTNVTFGIRSANTTNTEFNITSNRTDWVWLTDLALSTVRDGIYYVTVYANDTLDNFNGSAGSYSNFTAFVVDGAPPNVTYLFVNVTNQSGYTSNFTRGGVIRINATVNDSTTYVKNVTFSVRSANSTNTEFNLTTNRTDWVWFTDLALSTVRDGIYYISVYANDTLDNFNGSAGSYSNFTAFVVDQTPPNVTYLFVNVTNQSGYTTNFTRGVIRLNATVNDSTTYVRNVTFGIRTIDRALSNATEFNVTTNRTDWVWFADLPLSTVSDGLYYVVVYANDTLNNFNGSVGSYANFTAFVVDRTPPNVSALIVGNLTNGINLSSNLTNPLTNYLVPLNVSANDTTTYVQTLIFNVSNSTGLVNDLNGSRNNTKWNASQLLNLSLLGDGLFFVQVIANDSLGNKNNTVNFTFRIDRNPPTVTVSCGGPYTAGQTVTCTCTATDTGGSLVQTGPRFSNAQSTESTTATGTGGTSSGCEAIDYAGNVRTGITSTWTVTAASSGGGGGSGGSGGGSSSGVSGQLVKRVWTSINAGETAKVAVTNGAIGVTEVSFAVESTTYGAWVQVKKLDSLPSSVDAPDTSVYRALEITQRNVESALSGSANIKFKVEKSWLSENDISASNVALFRYAGSDWTVLPTTMGEDDGTYVYYTASTPGFSYFVIGEAEAAAPVAEEAAPVEEAAGEEAPVEAAAEAPAAAMKKKSNAVVWIVPLVVLLIVGGLLYWYWQRK